MHKPDTVPALHGSDRDGWIIRPFGSLHTKRGVAQAAGTRDEAELECSRLALSHALRGHEFEGVLLTLISELESTKAAEVVADPYGLAQRLRRLRMERLEAIKAEVTRWEAHR